MSEIGTPPGVEDIVSRIRGTDATALRRTARGLLEAADECERVERRLEGVTADLAPVWTGAAGAALQLAAEQLHNTMTGLPGALRTMAEQLQRHAGAADVGLAEITAGDEAWTALGGVDAPNDVFARRRELELRAERIAAAFHDSERSVRDCLWTVGAEAPGALPVPTLPPVPAQPWWEDLLFGRPSGSAMWLPGENGHPRGWDEDGDIVPAFRADPVPFVYAESGVSPGPVFRWLVGLGRAAEGTGTADDAVAAVTRAIKASHGFRDGHIDRHIRKFYRLGPDEPVPPWMKDNFVALVGRSATQGRAFSWSVKSSVAGVRQPTYATLLRDPATKQWLVTQFYATGPEAGQFATAFRPTVSQLTRMLQEKAVAL